MLALAAVERWPVRTAAGAVVSPDGGVDTVGDVHHVFRLASLAKMFVGWTALVAVEEGTIDLDEPLGSVRLHRHDAGDSAGHPVELELADCTPRHLLAHAGGFAFDSYERLAPPGTRRIYSNTGIEIVAEVLARRAGMTYADYQREALFEPLGMAATDLVGSPAKDVYSTVADLLRFVAEVRTPTLVAHDTARQFSTVQFPGLPGTVPGIARYDDCPWGLGTEIRGTKQPHWTGEHNSPATFGHFGGAGTLLWVDPEAMTASVVLTDRPFDDWAAEAVRSWSALADSILAEVGAPTVDHR